MDLARPIRDYVNALVHPSVQHDALMAARHRTFIAPKLFGSFVVLAALPVFIALRGAPAVIEVIIFAWFMAPMLIAYFLSRTGRYESAHVLSALALIGLGTTIAAVTGGIGSFATIWLVIVPLEVALCVSRRVIAFASTFAFGAAAILLLLGAQDLLPYSQSSAQLAALGVGSAMLYATAIALGAQSLLRTSFRLRKTEADRYRLLAGIMTDTITRHDRNGGILFASPAAEPLFGIAARDLIGNGLFDRVHVADRPAYLTALADAAAFGQERSVEFRARRDMIESARGQFIWVEMRCQPVNQVVGSANSEECQVIAIMRDVTDRKEQQQAIANFHASFEEATTAGNAFLSIAGREQVQTIQRLSGNSEIMVKKSA